MSIPASYHTPAKSTTAVTGGATVEALAAVSGKRFWITGITVDITTAGAAGTTVTVQEITTNTVIAKCDASAVGQKAWWFGERGYPLIRSEGLEVVNGAAVVSSVVITGYYEKP